MQTKTKTRWQYKAFAGAIALLALSYASATSAITGAELPIPAQIPELEEQIDADISPSSPKPGDEVTIALSAFGTNLNVAKISWSVNGSTVKSGQGAKSIKVALGKAGKPAIITVTIEPLNGNAITKTFTISPQTVDIIWEARTYTPPFYRGKALYSPQENVIFVAMPNLTSASGIVTNPNTVTYDWKRDATAYADRSGYGVNAFSYKGSILLKPVIMDVSATDNNGLNARNYISLSPTAPVVGLYEESPLYGIFWNSELSSGFDFGEREERTVAAIPYYFGSENKAGANLSYIWTINGVEIGVPRNQNAMTFRNTEGKEGISAIGIAIGNSINFLERARGGTVINFKAPSKAFSF